MYSNEKSVQILLKLLKEYKIKDVVLSPGGSNAPIVKSFEYDKEFNCYSVVDERNAAYVALGMAQQSRRPVACVCTAGTAVSNYLPGITEAFYQNVPVVAITSDGLSSLLDQLELQKIDQVGIFKGCIKKEVALPAVKTEMDEWYCNRLVNEALLELNHHGTGPVHINIPITLSLECSEKVLPKQRIIERHTISNTDFSSFSSYLRNKKIMIVVGENLKIKDTQIKLFNSFFEKYDCFYSVEAVSNLNCNGCVITYPITETEYAFKRPELIPDIVISLGNFVATYKLKEILRMYNKKIENWLVSDSGCVRDPYFSLTNIFEGNFVEFFQKLTCVDFSEANHEYYKKWNNAASSINLGDLKFSSLSIARELSKSIPDYSILHTAILNSTRITQFFDFNKTVKYYSNLGALGIDGCLATFIGHSLVTENLSFLLIGDLSFFYGMNGISIRGIKNNVRIILLNNGGGGEFKIKLPYNGMDKFVCAQNKRTAKGWVESLGFEYFSAASNDEVRDALSIFAQESETPLFLEVFIDIDEDSQLIRDIYASNTNNHSTASVSLKKGITKLLPSDVKDKIKNILNP